MIINNNIPNGSSKLTEEQVLQVPVLRAQGLTQKGIGDLLGVHPTLISDILRGKSWAHLFDPPLNDPYSHQSYNQRIALKTPITIWGRVNPKDAYFISIDGIVIRSGNFKKRLKLRPDNYGYLTFNCWIDFIQKKLLVHNCVAIIFLGDRSSEGLQVQHLDGNKLNNSMENLYWGTPQEVAYEIKIRKRNKVLYSRHLKVENDKRSKLKEADIYGIRELNSNGIPQEEIAAFFNTSQTQISNIVNRRSWAYLPNDPICSALEE